MDDRKVIYHVDTNCKDLRELVLALIPIHRRFGVECKVGITQRGLAEETGLLDEELFKETAKSTIKRGNLTDKEYIKLRSRFRESELAKLMRHHGRDIVFYDPSTISLAYKNALREQVEYFCAHTDEMPEKMQKDIQIIAHRLMRKSNPAMLRELTGYELDTIPNPELEREQANRIVLALHPDNAAFNEILLSAFHGCSDFRGLFNKTEHTIKKADGNTEVTTIAKRFRNSADLEERVVVSDSLWEQADSNRINHVIISMDDPHRIKMREVIDDKDNKITGGFPRTGQSFVLSPDAFIESCKALAKSLKKIEPQTPEFKQEIEKLRQTASAHRSRGGSNETYCQMVEYNRYGKWFPGSGRDPGREP